MVDRKERRETGDEEEEGRDLCSWVGSAEERPCLLPDQHVMSEDVLSRQINSVSTVLLHAPLHTPNCAHAGSVRLHRHRQPTPQLQKQHRDLKH